MCTQIFRYVLQDTCVVLWPHVHTRSHVNLHTAFPYTLPYILLLCSFMTRFPTKSEFLSLSYRFKIYIFKILAFKVPNVQKQTGT